MRKINGMIRKAPKRQPEYTVYLYVSEGKAVYAGATENLRKRLEAHRKESEDFRKTSIYIHRCSSEKEMLSLETNVINAFKPRRNKAKKMLVKIPTPNVEWIKIPEFSQESQKIPA